MATVSELQDKLSRASNSIKRAREEGEGIATRAINLTLSVGTGAGIGFFDAKYGKPNAALGGMKKARIPGTEIELDAGFATLGGLLGISGILGKASDEVAAMAGAAGAIAGRDYVYGKVEEK